VIASLLNVQQASDFDIKGQGKGMLKLIAAAGAGKGNGATLAANTKKLASLAAANVALGDKEVITSPTLTVTAEKVPAAEVVSAPLGTNATKVQLNNNVIASAGADVSNSEVALASSVYEESPYDLPATASVQAARSTELDLSVDGEETSVKDLTTPIQLEMQASNSVNGATCRFYNTTSNVWSTEGVTTVSQNAVDGKIVCNTTHFSMFGASGAAAAPEDTTTTEEATTSFSVTSAGQESSTGGNTGGGSGASSFGISAAFGALMLALAL